MFPRCFAILLVDDDDAPIYVSSVELERGITVQARVCCMSPLTILVVLQPEMRALTLEMQPAPTTKT